jgi:hypothetical protein
MRSSAPNMGPEMWRAQVTDLRKEICDDDEGDGSHS